MIVFLKFIRCPITRGLTNYVSPRDTTLQSVSATYRDVGNDVAGVAPPQIVNRLAFSKKVDASCGSDFDKNPRNSIRFSFVALTRVKATCEKHDKSVIEEKFFNSISCRLVSYLILELNTTFSYLPEHLKNNLGHAD